VEQAGEHCIPAIPAPNNRVQGVKEKTTSILRSQGVILHTPWRTPQIGAVSSVLCSIIDARNPLCRRVP
jgi:hypothetical protein